MEIFWTVISGVSIYVLGQIIQNFVLKPLQDFKLVKIDISHRLKFNSNIYTNLIPEGDARNRASGDARDMSCNLESKYLAIPCRWFFTLSGVIPRSKNLADAAKRLIRLSNARDDAELLSKYGEDIEEIKKLLKLKL